MVVLVSESVSNVFSVILLLVFRVFVGKLYGVIDGAGAESVDVGTPPLKKSSVFDVA